MIPEAVHHGLAWYQIRMPGYGLCLTASHIRAGASVFLEKCLQPRHQRWFMHDGQITILHTHYTLAFNAAHEGVLHIARWSRPRWRFSKTFGWLWNTRKHVCGFTGCGHPVLTWFLGRTHRVLIEPWDRFALNVFQQWFWRR